MRGVARLALLATLLPLAGCTCCLSPASGPARTLSADCLAAWVGALASPSGGVAVEAAMRVCGSLEDYVDGAQAAHFASDPVSTKLIAEGLCATGRFNDTPICGQLGITPPPPTPTPIRDCGVPDPDPVFNAWSQACSRGDPSAAGAPWGTLPPGYSPLPLPASSP